MFQVSLQSAPKAGLLTGVPHLVPCVPCTDASPPAAQNPWKPFSVLREHHAWVDEGVWSFLLRTFRRSNTYTSARFHASVQIHLWTLSSDRCVQGRQSCVFEVAQDWVSVQTWERLQVAQPPAWQAAASTVLGFRDSKQSAGASWGGLAGLHQPRR